MTGILGGGRSIHLSYGNVYKIVCDLRLLLLQKVSVVGSLRRRSLYPAELLRLKTYYKITFIILPHNRKKIKQKFYLDLH